MTAATICEHGRMELMCSKCMDARPRATTKGVIKLDHATVHVELKPTSEGFVATALVEMHCKEFGASEPMKFRASTPKEAWAAMSSEVYKKLTRFN